MTISERTRFEVLRRDGFRCRYCGAGSHEARLEIDHLHPRAVGGSDETENLVTSCRPCNAGKAARAGLILPVGIDPLSHILSLEPALVDLLAEAAHQRPGPDGFCANRMWYGPGGLKERLCELVGWEARRPELRSIAAYDLAYEAVYELLPACQGRACWCL